MSARLTVVDGKLRRSTWAILNVVHGFPDRALSRKLEGPVHAPLTGTLAPAAAASPTNSRLLAYNSFARKRPVLRLYDARSRDDRILDEGTFSFAWRRDGALAYFKGLRPRVRDPIRYRGHVVVRRSARAQPVRWTTSPSVYVVSAWAGRRLIVHERRGQDWPNLVVFDAPRRKRVLSERAGLVALSPDARHAFITKAPEPAPVVAVVDVATGDEVATFSFAEQLDPVRRQPINYVADSGAWVGDTVIAAVARGVAFFRVSDAGITLEELLAVDPDVFPLGAAEPKADVDGRHFVAAVELTQRPRAGISRTALMECDRVRRRCVLGRSAPSFQPPRPIYNPSRP